MTGWQIGDLALCLKRGAWLHSISNTADMGPEYNQIVRVRDIGMEDDYPVLWLEGFPGDAIEQSFCASRFRKIRPDKREACEPEFVTLLKRSKRKVEA